MKEKRKSIKSFEKDIKNALIKKALGYDAKETVEEYVSGEEGEIKLSKKKITVKNVPPDITALKLLMDDDRKPLAEMTDGELQEEKERLLKLLAEYKD